MDLLPNMSPLHLSRGLLEITSATFDELAELHFNTCARFADRNVDGVSGIFKAEDFADFVDHQRRQYQALWSDREEYMGSASAIIRRAVQQVNDLWADPPEPGAAFQAGPAETPQPEVRAAAHPTEARAAENHVTNEPMFELFEDQSGEHRFRLIGDGGSELLASVSYKTRQGARNGVEVVRRNAGNDSRYQRIETDSGLPMFNLKAGNHQIIGTSLPHQSGSDMEDALAAVKAASATAVVAEP